MTTASPQEQVAQNLLLDCKGLPCPQPVLRAKEALDAGARLLLVQVDNEGSRNNLLRFAQSRGYQAQAAVSPEGDFIVSMSAGGTEAGHSLQLVGGEDVSCPASVRPKLLYVVASDSMGRGSDQLGWALLQTYIQTIRELSPLPGKILFYNSGVKLVSTDSGAISALRQLQEQGVAILACGTCLDFFGLTSALKVGHISNMYEIMQAMMDADKILSPW